MDWVILIKLALPYLIAGAAAYGGVRQGLNGQKARITEIKTDLGQRIDEVRSDLKEHTREETDFQLGVISTQTRVETKLDLLLQGHRKD